MVPSLFEGSQIGVLEQVVNFSQKRHGVLAGNIANIDTPGYKTRDLSPEKFEASLKKALTSRNERQTIRSQQQIPFDLLTVGNENANQSIDDFKGVKDSMKEILYHDGSDVSLEMQITEISKNQATHNLALNLMSAQFRQLKAAISERVV